MPELPEVEVTKLGMHCLLQHKILAVDIRHFQLRYPVSPQLIDLTSQCFIDIQRRGKYLIFVTNQQQYVLVHLGMSGSLRITNHDTPLDKHDHIVLYFEQGLSLRYKDPRRFGLWLYLGVKAQHPLLQNLGPEPLTEAFNSQYFYQITRNKKTALKKCLMDNRIVVGVGNIYANEALFQAKLQPQRLINSLTFTEIERIVQAVKVILQQAILVGGTTLKDFSQSDGRPGYFTQDLQVYGRAGKPCVSCGFILAETRFDQRTCVFCPKCQQ